MSSVCLPFYFKGYENMIPIGNYYVISIGVLILVSIIIGMNVPVGKPLVAMTYWRNMMYEIIIFD